MVYGHKGGGKWKKLAKKTVFSLAFADEIFVNLLLAGRRSDFIEDLYLTNTHENFTINWNDLTNIFFCWKRLGLLR